MKRFCMVLWATAAWVFTVNINAAESSLSKTVSGGMHESQSSPTEFNKALPADDEAHTFSAGISAQNTMDANVSPLDAEMHWTAPTSYTDVGSANFNGTITVDEAKDGGYFSKFWGVVKGGEGEGDPKWSFFGKLDMVKVEVLAIKFDHTGPYNNKSDGLNLRKNYNEDLEHTGDGIGDGEWLLENRNEPVLYVADQKVTIKAKFRITPAGKAMTAKVKAQSEDLDWFKFDETLITFNASSGESEYVEIPLTGKTPSYICKILENLTWTLTEIDGNSCSNEMNITGPHEISIVLDVPQAPWYLTTSSEPWDEALDILTRPGAWNGGKTNKTTVVANCAERIWANGYFNYDTVGGASFFYSNSGFELTRFLGYYGSSPTSTSLNCLDCGLGVLALSSLMGCEVDILQINENFPLNCIDPIGFSAEPTNNCFSSPLIDDDARQGGFGMHIVARHNSTIYDATLRVDIDDNADNVIGENPNPGSVETPAQFTWHKPRGDSPSLYLNRLVDSWVHPTALYKNTTPNWRVLGNNLTIK